MVDGEPVAVAHVVASVEPPELVDVAVGVGVAVAETPIVGVGLGVGVADVLIAVGVAVGAVVDPLATGLADTTTPEGAAVGLRGLLPVTLPPPEEQAAAATTADPANSPSIKRLYIEGLQNTEKGCRKRHTARGGRAQKTIGVFKLTRTAFLHKRRQK
jgi:hypothetical protein